MRTFIFLATLLCANIMLVTATPTKIMIRAKARMQNLSEVRLEGLTLL